MTLFPHVPLRPAIRRLAAFSFFLSVAATVHAQGTAPAHPLAQRHGQCAAPAFDSADTEVMTEPGGYGIEVQGERYWMALDGRTTFALRPAGSGEAVAQVKVDRPAEGSFDEQARWRQRWLEDVAARTGVVPLRRALPGGGWLMTVNKRALTGHAAGLSVLADPRRKAFVQWDWAILPRYAGMQEATAMQDALWQRLLPCLVAP